MENYQYSYPDSVNSSPRSRDVDENASWDEPPSSNNYKVKFLCSYGGKIHPRPHDNQLTYVSGDTKILGVERNIRFATLLAKLSSLCDYEVCFKYQLPEEDLDALISVTNDEDLEHMMAEYDRLHRASVKPARMRLFLFPVNPSVQGGFGTGETKSERQWFVDALNSVQIQSPTDESSPQSAAASNPDFLFGLDKGGQLPPSSAAAKLQDPPPAPVVPEVSPRETLATVERHVISEPVVSPAEIQRQMEDLQRLQLASQEKPIYQRKSDESNPWNYGYGGEYSQKPPDQLPPTQTPVPVSLPATYWPERHMSTATYQTAPHPTVTEQQQQQPMYLIQTPAGIFHSPAMRPATSQVSQPYYGMQRTVQDLYRDQTGYSAVQPPSSIQLPKVGGGGMSSYPEAFQMVRPQLTNEPPSYPPAMYDGAGRQVYYTTSAGPMGTPYQAMSMQTMPPNTEVNKIVSKTSDPYSV
ncbi:soluble scavenger receptor cysteine-rich domain-containing protein SSC5D-like [Impatiens glandulifera]|uniref:soluble scavenger receptor cysteine-rich domain-containing protein SSC5D-like n=1 Tax=Impatiens glandulifera TaxID=253017 RepID=UPI001FB0E702|nr:soluble scavenger receptor cysteine-rich domain-containing protein SSC5D-like [Impatiens glandulifera]